MQTFAKARGFGLAAAVLSVAACDSGNPVAPAPPEETPSTTFSITLKADPPKLTAGSATGSVISVTVVRSSDLQPPADGSEVILDTSLGNFGIDAQGNPIQQVTLNLRGGEAQATLFADDGDVGTASVLAQFSDSSAQLNLAIEEPGDPPTADFQFVVDGFQVTFADASTGDPTSWSWSFGDGESSTEQNPTHVYLVAGTYVVQLTVSNAGGSNSKNQLITVPSGDPPNADFSFQVEGLTVHFLDASIGNPTSWSWRFGDGAASLDQNPTHTYQAAGTYTVTLTVTNDVGSASRSQLVTVPSGDPPTADFTFQVDGLTVRFLDASTGGPTSWLWDFGDNTASREQNPTHPYQAAGTYTVTLTATNAAGSDTRSQLVTVSQGDPPAADFTFQADGLSVSFLDASTGDPTAWAWDFGDGGTSAAQNPRHAYAAAGIYTVSLTVTNDGGSDTASQLVTVSAGDPPSAAFTFQADGLTVTFVDASTGDPTSWSWDFGDGETSTERDPAPHTYAAAGTYAVRLTVSNAAGSDSASQLVTVPSDDPPAAQFSFEINDRTVIFTDLSTGDPTEWSWEFGDGATSSEQNPVHCYAADGTYAVSLTVTNAAGSGSTSKFVTVSDPDDDPCP